MFGMFSLIQNILYVRCNRSDCRQPTPQLAPVNSSGQLRTLITSPTTVTQILKKSKLLMLRSVTPSICWHTRYPDGVLIKPCNRNWLSFKKQSDWSYVWLSTDTSAAELSATQTEPLLLLLLLCTPAFTSWLFFFLEKTPCGKYIKPTSDACVLRFEDVQRFMWFFLYFSNNL